MLILLPLTLATAVSAAAPGHSRSTFDNAFIIQLASAPDLKDLPRDARNHVATFQKRATSIDYSIRHEFHNSAVFLGLSIQMNGNQTQEYVYRLLRGIEGVVGVSSVSAVRIPAQQASSKVDPYLSYSSPPPLPSVADSSKAKLGSALEMGGVDKLHQRGIKGKGIKVGIIDTGVDYRHPALGAGFGPGHKIAGGHSFVYDNGTLGGGPDPFTSCYGGGHGTHVAGIIGMDSVPSSFDITGVAPEASIYMYRTFDCNGRAGSDTIMAAMSKAQEDGVDIVSMSLGIGPASFSGAVDPLAAITKTLTDAGIAVIVAQSNDANEIGSANNDLYTEEWPSTESTALAVGAISNTYFPVVYPAVDSSGATLQYASVYPLNFSNGADVLLISDGCDSELWNDALQMITNINETIIAFQVYENCKATQAGSWSSSDVKPVYIMALNSNTTNPYLSQYDTPSQGYFGAVQFINMNAHDGKIFSENYGAGGGYSHYKLKFSSSGFTSSQQPGGGLMDYYSSFGPTWHDYDLKPQVSAPGGHVLSTWPLGPLGGYAILSGTSMATPYLAASYALVKSQFPKASIAEITTRLQVNAKPLPWIWNNNMLSATYQQGAGLVDVFNAIYSDSTISPGQLKISDNSKTSYGAASITIENKSTKQKTYILSHIGAGYSDYYLQYAEPSQQPLYGTATFPTPTVTIEAGQSTKVSFSISPPSGVRPSSLPVFGGFITVTDSDQSDFSIPYVGPPYSLFNTPYIYTSAASSGVQLPSVYSYNADQSNITYDIGLLEVVASYGFGGAVPTLQWTTEFSISLLPANTTIKPNHYGFSQSIQYPYIPSSFASNSTVFSHPSFGTLINDTGLMWPENNAPFDSDMSVKGDNGVRWKVGNGDYRWFAAVLRWGGTSGRQEEYDTWLGPVIRFVNGTSG